jgi:hypothetical protein
MPSHKLLLKIGAPVILLRNLDPLAGLCNETRLIVQRFMMRVVEVEIITCKGAGNVVFISRIKFISDNNGLPFTFAKKQFPLWLAYAMTIIKSQGRPSLMLAFILQMTFFCTVNFTLPFKAPRH